MKKILLICLAIIWVANIFAQQVIPVVQTGHSGKIQVIAWDDSGRYIASADDNNDIVINDVISGKQFYKVKLPGKTGIKGLKFENSNLLIDNLGVYYSFDLKTLKLNDNAKSFSIIANNGGYHIRGSAVKKGSNSLINKDIYVHFTCVAQHPVLPIVIAGDERGWIYFCNKSLKIKKCIRTHQLNITSIDFSKDNKYVAIASADRSISIWSLPDINFEKRIIPRSFNVYGMDSHPNGDRLTFGDELGFTYLMVFEDDKITCEGINTHNGRVNDVVFTPNKMCIASAGSDNKAAIVDFENMKPLQYFTLHPSTSKLSQTFNVKAIQERATNEQATKLLFDENVYSVAVSPDGKQIAYSGGTWGKPNPMLKVAPIGRLNLDKPKINRKKLVDGQGLNKKNNTHIFYQLYFDNDKQFWGLGESYDKAQAYKTTLTGYDELNSASVRQGFSSFAYEPNKMMIILKKEKDMNTDYLIKKDMTSGDEFICNGFTITKKSHGKTVSFVGHRGFINDIEIIKSKNFLVSCAEDASMIFWNLNTGEKIMTVYVVDQGKLVFVTPDNYYMAQGDALTGLGFNYDGKVLPAEQFDLKYNRPDIVMEKMGIFRSDIITLYHKAYLKRLSKTGFTEDMLKGEMNLPELQILNLKDISYKTKDSNLKLNIKMTDNLHKIDRLNIWVNDVPYYGTRGLSLKDLNEKNLTKQIDLPLSAGHNLIQVSCLNDIGVESLKEVFEIEYESSVKTKPDLYLVSIAVSEYRESKYNLRYTVNDGKGFINLFKKRANNYSAMYVDSFYNASCTRDNVLNSKKRLMNSKPDDYVIVHIAGHGLLDDNLDFYFATSDIDFKNPSARGLNYEELEGLLDGIPARNKLFLMDACHSGEIDKDDDFAVEEVSGNNHRGVTLYGTRGEVMPKTGLQNSFELMRMMFADLKKGTGAVVISAASGGGYALENENIENGIFTFSFLMAFKKNKADSNKDGYISVSELRNFIFDEVKILSKGKQQPTSRKENLYNDFKIW